ncbi:MAG: signal peptidase I [Blautia sp.]
MKKYISEFCYKAGRILFGMFLSLVVINLIGYWAGIRPVAVVSGSMEPAIKTGSICWVNFHIEKEALRTGDILAFQRSDGKMVLHRIAGFTEDGIITKGDGNEHEDAGVTTYSQIRGKAIFSLPYIGWFFMGNSRQIAWILLAGSLILLALENNKNRNKNFIRKRV